MIKSDLYELEVVLEHIAPRVIYKGVLSTGWVRLDLWCKAQNHPFDNSSSNIFSLFQLETNNSFYKQCWPYMVPIQKITSKTLPVTEKRTQINKLKFPMF